MAKKTNNLFEWQDTTFNQEYIAALREANEMLRSCYQVVERKGIDTRWGALKRELKKLLAKEHKILKP